jgi:hypothetical protein
MLEKCLKLVVVEHAHFPLSELHVLHRNESFAGIELEYATNELVYAQAFVGCGSVATAFIDQVLLEAQQVNTSYGRDCPLLYPTGKLFQRLLHKRMRL